MRFLYLTILFLIFTNPSFAEKDPASIGHLHIRPIMHPFIYDSIEIDVFDKPEGRKTGTIKFQEVDPYFFFDSPTGKEEISLESLACYEFYFSIYEQQNDWAKTSAGWVKLSKVATYKSWREHFKKDDIYLQPFPYAITTDQALLNYPYESEYKEKKGVVDLVTGKVINLKGKNLHILQTKGDYALIVTTDKEGYYCTPHNVALDGHIGWIKFVNEQGHKLIQQRYGCC